MAQFFNNRLIIAPSTEVAIDDSNIGPTGTTSPQINVGILGLSTAGVPDIPFLVSSPDQATSAFGQGNLVDGILRAFSPSVVGGAQQVYGIRVNKGTQGTISLLDSNSVAAITLTTIDYGVSTRGLSILVGAATHAGTDPVPVGALKITASNPTLPEPVDDLGYRLLNVKAESTSGTVTVAKSSATVSTGYSAGQVTAIVVDTGGNYGGTPTVTLSAPQTAGGVQATGTVTMAGSAVSSIAVNVAGSGYTSAPTVTFVGGSPVTPATAHTTVGAVKTNPSVATSASGQSVHQLVNQQVVIANSGGTQPFTTQVTAESGGVLTLDPGDPFTRTNTATVTGTSAALLLYTATPGDQAGLPLVNYGTLSALAQSATSVSANWTVTPVTSMNPSPLALATVGASSSPTILDVRPTALSVSAGNTVVLTGIAQAVVDWLNGRGNNYFTAVRAAAGTVPAVTSSAQFATGGADDQSGGSLLSGLPLVVTNQDWQDALVALGTVDAPLFVLMSGSDSVISLGDAHAATMSSTGRMERIQIAGGELGLSTDLATGEAAALNSWRTCFIYPGIRDFDSDGNLQTLPPYYAAAMAAGLAAGLPENQALTGQTLRIQGLEVRSQLNGGTFGLEDVNACLQGGVMPIQFRPGRGFVIVQSITTWLSDPKFSKRELSVRRTVDRVSRAVRESLDTLIGTAVSPALINNVLNNARVVLESYAMQGFLVGDAANPAYLGLTASIQQGQPDTIRVSFQCSPGIPANYILVTMHLTAFSGGQ